MASLFSNRGEAPAVTPRQALQVKYNTARANLLLVVAFTVINVVLSLVGADTYFLFSASVPYYLVTLGRLLCGMYPPEFYEDVPDFQALNTSFLTVMAVIAFVIVALYVLCWLLCNKQRVAWMIVALVLFALDSVMMFFLVGISTDSIFDLLFHAWVLYYLVVGIYAHFKMKELPVDATEEPETENAENPENADSEEKPPVILFEDQDRGTSDNGENQE